MNHDESDDEPVMVTPESSCGIFIFCQNEYTGNKHTSLVAFFFLPLLARFSRPGIQDMLKKVAGEKGLDYDEWLKGLKSKKQWHVEVY